MIGRIRNRIRGVDINDPDHTDRSEVRHSRRGGDAAPQYSSPQPDRPRIVDDDPSLQSPSDRQRDALESQIRKRDHTITSLERDLVVLSEMSEDLLAERDDVRRSFLESALRHSAAVALWRRTNDGLRARVESFHQESLPEAAAEIAALIRDAAPANKDSAYLMTLQEQLKKATVKMENLAGQTEDAVHEGSEVVQSLRGEMEDVIVERVQIEVEMSGQMEELRKEKDASQKRLKKEFSKVTGEITFLEQQALDALSDSEEEGSDDEEENGRKEENVRKQKTPEELRRELRQLTAENERSIAILRSKLRDKEKELTSLKRLKSSQQVPSPPDR